MYLLKHLIWGQSQRSELNITLCCFSFQEGEQFVKKIGGIFAFKVKDGPGGKEATSVVDVKNVLLTQIRRLTAQSQWLARTYWL